MLTTSKTSKRWFERSRERDRQKDRRTDGKNDNMLKSHNRVPHLDSPPRLLA